jgi:hypothetical protein
MLNTSFTRFGLLAAALLRTESYLYSRRLQCNHL